MINDVVLSQNTVVNSLYQQGAWNGLLPVNIREVAQNLGYVVVAINRELYPTNDFMVLDDRKVLTAVDEETVAAKKMLFDFLMPDYALHVLVERRGISDITRLAKLLNVGENHLYEKLDKEYGMSKK